ncbi:chloride channel protein [Allorhizobium taibaishanense]|uniref:Chloride channel protein n=1 Tax=Allorhizobium taibaishanense TaxID=887144 RepID=A0A1Q9A809_9HYPH|nr:chloride channel protein [Allorhizobium taibaishanense]MBB4008342.1 H+/Cl- antiporter ClcA/predicted transcriptional regulator [Allorhizobium taibaishanense]OLP50693.1 chloride channel protein [Allorhizobium taibaishanense]
MINMNGGSAKRPPLGDHSADHRLLLLAGMAVVVGSVSAMGAWLLLRLIALATNFFWFGRLSSAESTIADTGLGLGIIAIPIIGSLIVGLMARFGSDKIRGHGIPEAIEAILYGESRLSLKVAILKPVSSAISIGSGGPFGAEGPIIMTGGAVGSLFAQCFHLSATERKTLLVAGAAAGMTGIFGTPLAAILLAIEVLLFEWKPRSFVPVVVAVLVSWSWRPALIGAGPLLSLQAAMPSGYWPLLAAAGIGTVVGLEAALLSTSLYKIEDLFHRLPIHWMWWPALGAIVVGLGGYMDPRVLGAGYANIQSMLADTMTIKMVVTLLAIKAIVWIVALGSGTSGGVLAPLLILGGAVGCLAGHALPGDPGFWTMIGMAAMMSGAMRAPLTGALFAGELTGLFEALPLTLAAAAAAYAVSVLVMRRSILTEKIARRGRHVLQEYTVDPLDFTQAAQIMTAGPATLSGDLSVAGALSFFTEEAVHRSYPVVDGENRLLGLVSRSDALRWRNGDVTLEATLAETLSDRSQPVAYPDTPSSFIADLIIETGVGRIPVVDPQTRKVVGIVSRQDLLKVRSVNRVSETMRSRMIGQR